MNLFAPMQSLPTRSNYARIRKMPHAFLHIVTGSHALVHIALSYNLRDSLKRARLPDMNEKWAKMRSGSADSKGFARYLCLYSRYPEPPNPFDAKKCAPIDLDIQEVCWQTSSVKVSKKCIRRRQRAGGVGWLAGWLAGWLIGWLEVFCESADTQDLRERSAD